MLFFVEYRLGSRKRVKLKKKTLGGLSVLVRLWESIFVWTGSQDATPFCVCNLSLYEHVGMRDFVLEWINVEEEVYMCAEVSECSHLLF